MLQKVIKRLRRKNRVKKQITWKTNRLRLSVFRSNAHIYAQIIDDAKWITLCSSSDLKMSGWTKTERAMNVWKEIALKAKSLKIEEIVFDRWWFAYHGRVKALAEWARSAWLKF